MKRINCFVLFLTFTVVVLGSFNLCAQNLLITETTIDDGNYILYCHPNFGNFEIKGNLDGALSPGERVRLDIEIKNQTNYSITNLYGIVFEYSPYVNVINPNCYDGIIGVRYSCPINPGTTATNFDPFIIEVSQDAPCNEFIDFGVTFYYTTSAGECSTQCTETHYFSLPVFSFNKPFILTPEQEIFPSGFDQKILETASNGQDIGIFYSGNAGIYFGDLNLDGSILEGPYKVYDISYLDDAHGVIWNDYKNRYELITNDLKVIPQNGMDITTLSYPPSVTSRTCYSQFYDMNSLNQDAIVLVIEADDLRTYICRYDASDYHLVDYTTLGITKSYIDIVCKNAIAAYYDVSQGFYYYFIAFEIHDFPTSRHQLHIAKVRGDNLQIENAYFTNIDSDYSSSPTIAIDSKKGIVALAYVKKDTDNIKKIFGRSFDINLNPICEERQFVGQESGKYSEEPKLIFNYENFYLINRDVSSAGSQLSSKIRIGIYDFSDNWPLPLEKYSTFASSEWLSMERTKPIMVSDKLHFFWCDTRNTFPNRSSIHYVESRTLSPFAPYNVNPFDDQIISQSYESSLHPSIVSKNNEFLVAWRYAGISSTGDIFYRRFSIDCTPIDSMPVQATFSGDVNGVSNTLARVDNGNYEIFFRGYSNFFHQYFIGRWREGNYEDRFYLNVSENLFLDASAGDPDVVLVTEQKDGDNWVNLYAYLWPHDYPPSYVRLTNLDYGQITCAKIIKIEGSNPYPYAVSWLEKNDLTSASTLWFGYLNSDLTFVSGYPVILESFNNLNVGNFALGVNKNIVSLLFSFSEVSNHYTLEMRNYPHPLNITNFYSTNLRQKVSSAGSPFLYPSINWNGNHFSVSWVEDTYVMSGNERLFWFSVLDDYGNQSSWPVIIASPVSYMSSGDFNYEVILTRIGAAAVYTIGSGTGSSNVYLTSLSWDPDSMVCNLYNEPPVVSTDGPFTIEYGSGATLSGTATDDTAMGDYIASAGWDLTQDGIPDFSGLNASISFDQLKQKGWITPKTANIQLRAVDRNGAVGTATTTLTIQDTTPPNVSVIFPNGGETLVNGGNYTIVWNGSDNYKINSYNLYYCTDFSGSNGTWIPIATGLSETIHSYDWTVPETLSSTCRIKITAVDGAPVSNQSEDISDNNFYIIQATTSSIKTIILNSATRMEYFYPGKSSLVSEKLAKLMVNGKVNGFVVDLDSIPGLSSLYAIWDADPENQDKANDVANAIRNYVKELVRNTYTNAEYLVIIGDDRIVPFFRITDGTPGTYSEDDYSAELNCSTTIGSALCQNYYLTDNNYGDLGHYENGELKEYETTPTTLGYLALPDLAIGRLVETPEEIATTIDAFITLDGQITLDSLVTADIFTSGYTFLNDSATSIDLKYDASYVVDHLLSDSWTGDQLKNAIFSDPHRINSINGHSNHYTLFTPDRGVSSTEMNSSYPGLALNGTVFYNVGCHGGLNVPSDFANNFDLPQMMMQKGVLSYIGNTGFGWGLKEGSGYSETLMELVTDKILYYDQASLGKAIIEAKREYFIQDKRYDVFDEKVLFESTLYGLPMFKIVMRQNGAKEAPKDFIGPTGPDEDEANGIKLKKKLTNSTTAYLLPPGVTELSLQFEFGPGTYQLINTPDGKYYKLNGKSNGEAGDSLQPLFIYESRLSGVASKGVLFTGGNFTNYPEFNPAIATPQSSSPIIPPEPIAPVGMTFIPTVNVIHPNQPTSLISTDLTKMTVYTGYYDDAKEIETIFNTMNFSIYYSNSTDKTPPTIIDPGQGNNLHTLNGTLCQFSVEANDASGIYRVIITYTEGISSWQSLDLSYNPSNLKWEGNLNLKRNINYFVQAIDNAGNVKVLKTGTESGNINPETGLPYITGARIFTVQLLDNDNDGMEDTWENNSGLNPSVNDADRDLDYDGLTNYEEFLLDTEANNADTDGDGDNDGSELHNGRNPLDSSDGKRITISVEKSGNDIILHFENTLGENSVIDGPYWVYRSTNDPHFDDNEILPTDPYPLPDGSQSYIDYGAGNGSDTYYYTVVNARFNSPAPIIDAVVPSSGSTSGGTSISVYGSNFSSGATVKIGGLNCTNVVVVNSTKITCKTPANSAGSKDVVVTNLNGQFGTLNNGFTYY